jgi:hypothetical protein
VESARPSALLPATEVAPLRPGTAGGAPHSQGGEVRGPGTARKLNAKWAICTDPVVTGTDRRDRLDVGVLDKRLESNSTICGVATSRSPRAQADFIELRFDSAWRDRSFQSPSPATARRQGTGSSSEQTSMLQLLCFLCLSVMMGPWTRASSCERVRLRGFSAAHGSTSSICVSLECSGPIAD